MKVTDILPGSPCWAQLSVRDMDRAKQFYGQLFGWTAEADPDPQYGGYTMFLLDGVPAAAVAPLMNPQQPVMWLLSFATEGVDATCAAAQEAGAQVWMEPMEVGGLGRWALLSDPTGAPFAAWQAREFGGFGVVEEPGAFGWADLSTRDKDAAVAFYRTAFGWQVWPDPNYAMVGLADRMFGGIMQLGPDFPPEVPAHWNPFFVVPDVDAAAALAAELGGEVLHGPVDVEMENGPRVAVVPASPGWNIGGIRPEPGI
ncbi:VOC family protein [Kitasatospora sp. NPDC058965]|uniref:VOC family protein n=1 Tax=Kitasatospora sp. NPDC058965 TaxID=3346682 RepID=UPI0036B793F4